MYQPLHFETERDYRRERMERIAARRATRHGRRPASATDTVRAEADRRAADTPPGA